MLCMLILYPVVIYQHIVCYQQFIDVCLFSPIKAPPPKAAAKKNATPAKALKNGKAPVKQESEHDDDDDDDDDDDEEESGELCISLFY